MQNQLIDINIDQDINILFNPNVEQSVQSVSELPPVQRHIIKNSSFEENAIAYNK